MINLGNMSIADLRLGASQVKAAYLGNKQIWGGEEPAPVGNWLRFDILADDTTIDLVDDSGTLEPPDLEFSVDDGATWTQWVPGSDYPHEMAGAVVYVRAGATGNTGFADPESVNAYWHFTSDDLFSASGNIMYLLSRDGSTGLSDYCFYRLFNGCTMLVDAGDLELPATTLAESCYEGMFRGCTSLSAAPELPATTLASWCYKDMLSACTSLTTAPELPATTLADGCYQQMFTGCTSLTAAPVLSAETLSGYCYYRMFSGCSSLSSMEVAFTDWNPQTATSNWVRNVAASGTFTCPAALPETRGDSNIPTGWNVVHPSQEISAVCFTAEEANSTVKLYKYNSGAPTLDIETSTDGSTWSAYTQGTVLTAANVGDKVYFRAGSTGNSTMSNSGNTNRFAITGKMAASGDIQYLLSQDGTTQPTTPWCFNCLFYGQSNLTKAPKCGATSTLQAECYGGTFESCIGLTEYVDTPLPQMWQDGATNLPHWTYINMFKNCTNLSAIAVNWTSWPMEGSSAGANPGWLANVKSTGVFYCPSSLPDKSGEYGIPTGWTRVNI